ncbi:hypothetical protein CLV92_12033 [Kineococcus xinjiangensis]|uniref:Helix-turn-helix protein n=1 Tax=Kineococcus xinjiangensis TaxID=512762 RepID=A0A2S6ICG1_9ACTN|nr:hypothetical protein CLV92_12033 [Kineococcus xinjiangensis]
MAPEPLRWLKAVEAALATSGRRADFIRNASRTAGALTASINDDGVTCATWDDLVAATGCSRRRVAEHVAWLRAAGWLHRQAQTPPRQTGYRLSRPDTPSKRS